MDGREAVIDFLDDFAAYIPPLIQREAYSHQSQSNGNELPAPNASLKKCPI